ncbi:hypothetical protein D3C86_2084840 [compost metagenome]
MTEKPPTEASEEKVREFVDFIRRVVGEEDLPMSRKQQRALSSGLMPQVQFGRNEVGLQHYYHWLEQVMAARSNNDIDRLFSQSATVTA